MSCLSAARAGLVTGIVLGATCASVIAGPTASAASLPTPSVSKSTVGANEYFTISGTGCIDPAPGAPLPGVSISGYQIGDGSQVAPDGSWSLSNSFSGAPPGTYTIQATCHRSDGNVAYPSIAVTVAGVPQAPPPAPQPPVTVATPTPPPTTAPRTTAPRTTAPRTTASSGATTSTPPAASTSAPATTAPSTTAGALAGPAPAPGCTDCAAISGDEPLTPGRELSLRYAGFQPGEQITVVMHSTPVELGTFTADSSGVVTAEVTIPASAEAGQHTLTLSGPVTGDQVVKFRLAAAQQRESAAAPAPEGTDLTLPLALGGAALVLLGAGGFVLHRRRTAGAAQPTATPIAEPTA